MIQHYLDWSEQLEQTLKAFVSATQQPGPFQPPPLPENQPVEQAEPRPKTPGVPPTSVPDFPEMR